MIDELSALREDMARLESTFFAEPHDIHHEHVASARNLVHYLALRRHDIRDLQKKLTRFGLSSLGRAESHALAAIDTLLIVLRRVLDPTSPLDFDEHQPGGPAVGELLLYTHTDTLLGTPPKNRKARIMVTLPSDAADIEALQFIAKHADLVGLSFTQQASDVIDLQEWLRKLDAPQMGIILKIETSRGFQQLLEILLAAMRTNSAGIMIARGDLAVEYGYERLAEVQEEMLWLCEAAHIPVDLGHPGARKLDKNRLAFTRRDHGCGARRSSGMRHAQQGTSHSGGHTCA